MVPRSPITAHLSLLIAAGLMIVFEMVCIPMLLFLLGVFILAPGVAMIFTAIHFDLVVRPRFSSVYNNPIPFYSLDLIAALNLLVSFVCLVDDWLAPDESASTFETVFWIFFSFHLLSFSAFILNLVFIWFFFKKNLGRASVETTGLTTGQSQEDDFSQYAQGIEEQ